MKNLHRLPLCFLLCFVSSVAICRAETTDRELYEIRTYRLGLKGDAAAIDQYLSEAYLPALKRLNIGPVGAFTNASQDESGIPQIVLVIPYKSASQIDSLRASLLNDSIYQQAADRYLSRDAKSTPYERISSELVSAMDCWPKVAVPDGSLENGERVFELRLYESPNERLGDLKVDMFNNGEVPIFLDCQIQPIFIGQSLVGPQTPNLTYLTVYKNEANRADAWKAFRVNADWQVLKQVAKYQGTVSHIDKYVLVPKPYSEM